MAIPQIIENSKLLYPYAALLFLVNLFGSSPGTAAERGTQKTWRGSWGVDPRDVPVTRCVAVAGRWRGGWDGWFMLSLYIETLWIMWVKHGKTMPETHIFGGWFMILYLPTSQTRWTLKNGCFFCSIWRMDIDIFLPKNMFQDGLLDDLTEWLMIRWPDWVSILTHFLSEVSDISMGNWTGMLIVPCFFMKI